ncbi:MAG: hypothetical protein GMKNLPBB_01272 [Myxococcota bacterium]|nr:hypothetical protein [Myxococcota bacterium]
MADHRGHCEDEGDRPLAAVPARHRRQPTAHALGRDPEGLADAVDKLLGTTTWYDDFYKVEHNENLFGNNEERVIKATNETIGRYFNDRLKSVFAAVADEPKVLRNSANCPLYLLCFAAGNDKGAPIALRIASHLLIKGVQ